MPSTSRRRLLALAASGGLGALGGYGYAVRDDPQRNPLRDADCDPAPLTSVPTEWPYPGYDANRTGAAPAESAPDESLTERWHAETEKGAIGQPVAANGLVFVCFAPDFGGDDAVQMLRAYDLQTGEERWRQRLAPDYFDRFPPVVALGDSLYTIREVDGTDVVAALAMSDGSIRWQRSPRLNALLESDARYAPELTVFDGHVYSLVEGVGPSGDRTFVQLLHPQTGDECRRMSLPTDDLSSPVFADGFAAFAEWGDAVVGVERTTREVAWRTTFDTGTVRLSAAEDRLYVSGFDGIFAALSPADGERLWTHETTHYLPGGTEGDKEYALPTLEVGVVIGELLVLRERVYSDYSDRMKALDAETGEVQWTYTPDHPAGEVRLSRPVAAGSRVYATELDYQSDRWRLVQLGFDDGDRLESVELAGIPTLRATPIVTDSTVVVPTNRGLQAFGGE
ncbi:Outer membrane protein assembly factor BamB, contains PQQ-like beta-propeller repeat [Halogranum rubrum]|uniref:Outer membrane protein assembly factor BamB, contains PQQ-like beta-propeller repeat n=1 Tax=Halogranum rubrum TaxID=553466 RepID=A0A1I4C6Z9_9EURY|nr:PQQ-binding-like beta-propeller repeat protein [Halogranum rubrum]SFK75926.1 Outer membrane protein assembly factor BamB, contains PQQ-like beta-propeller repeat [Halogranum rubrum]